MNRSDGQLPAPNSHVEAYLSYYLALEEPPRFAVLLSGRWGVGKTFQARSVVSRILQPTGQKVALVSLYGLKSHTDIDDAIFSSLYPWTNNDTARIASAVGKAFLKHAKIEMPTIKSSDLINKMSVDVFVFDDLERCSLPVQDSLGYINQLVERDGYRVIILANEGEISDQDRYVRAKEKLIGKTIAIEADFEGSFSYFCKNLRDSQARDFLEKNSDAVRDVFHQSQFQNLRILQQTMWDFARLYVALDEQHRQHPDAMHALVRLFFILSFEFRSGSITEEALRNRTEQAMLDAVHKVNDSKDVSPFSGFSTKYPGFYAYDSMLSDSICVDILVKGVINPDALKASLDSSYWFANNNEPSWVTLWRSYERGDDAVAVAANKLQEEFQARKYSVSGEVLHVFGQMLFLADLNVSGRDRSQTVEDCKAYIDDLRAQKKLETVSEAFADTTRYGSYGGLGFSQIESEEFREIRDYLAKQRAEFEVENYVVEAVGLLALLSENPVEFVRRVSYVRDGQGQFANRPVLAALDPDAFAETLITLDPLGFREVLLGLSMRYDSAKLASGRELADEQPWLRKLISTLNDKAEKLNPFGRDRISRNVEWYLQKVLDELKA